MVSKKRISEIVQYFNANGKEATLTAFANLKEESLNRYIREYKKFKPGEAAKTKQLKKILEMYTPKELEAIARGGRVLPGMSKAPEINFSGKRVRVGVISDTHIGSNCYQSERLFAAFDEFHRRKIDFITHVGDVTEGMSNRPGHVYELNYIGYGQQKAKAISDLSEWTDTDMYLIDGNHDQWFIKSNGAYIVRDICDAIPNAHFLGHDEGDINLAGKTTLKLWHGGDGNSYATSYRIQKVVESLTGGNKPGVMILGHVHKQLYMQERNIHCISAGSIQSQTKWMRGKRIAAHVGFWIIDIWVNSRGVSKIAPTWYPFYV